MPIDFEDIRSQLRPGFTPVNSALLVVLFFLAWPLSLAMLGYVLAGDRIGLDLGKPVTYSAAMGRLKLAFKGAVSGFQNASGPSSNPGSGPGNGTPDASFQSLTREKEKLFAERSALEQERREFEAEKKAFRENNQR